MSRSFLHRWARIGMGLVMAGLLAGCGTSQGPCKDDYDCEGSETCNLATKKCEPIVCRQEADCGDPRLTCVDNVCVTKTPAE